ncbi:MAG: FAD-binding protein, partial [Alphaproteobacteria bacterium]|nr:FAD-binding protein [Alphaproteobacteria bacterium]
MEQAYFDNGLLDRLPVVRGSLTANGNLSNQTWFRAGGPAEVLFKPYDAEDLAYLLSNCPEDVPVTVLGNASNVLIRDKGVPGVVIRLGPNFVNMTVGEDWIKAGGGSNDYNVAKVAQVNGLAGLEWLSGIPGTIGGGVKMNAGAYGREMKDVLMRAKIMDRKGRTEEYMADELGLRYRGSNVNDESIVIEAVLKAESGDREQIAL